MADEEEIAAHRYHSGADVRWSSDREKLPMSESHDVGDAAGQEAGDNGVYPNTRLEEFS
jgi:hypothetical protein